MNMRIDVIVENTTERATLLAEHGLAYWIESGNQHVLFDTGQGLTLISNAYKLGVPLFEADAIVLSHGHYDHTGGLADALRNSTKGRVFAHPDAMNDKFTRTSDGVVRMIGAPQASRQSMRRHSHLWVKTEHPTAVLDGLMVTGPVPRVTDFEDTGGPFYLDVHCQRPDPLIDDQALFFETPQGTVVLLGCAHAGVINTLRYVLKLTDDRPLYAVLGGMHLVHASTERVKRTIEEFRRLGVKRLGPAHCTGGSAVAALSNAFPGQILPCHVGSRLEFDTLSPKNEATKTRKQGCRSSTIQDDIAQASILS